MTPRVEVQLLKNSLDGFLSRLMGRERRPVEIAIVSRMAGMP